jgi:hypothetical protein
MGKMKTALMIIAAVAIAILIVGLVFGCSSPESIKKQNAINDYTQRLNEWSTYFNKVAGLALEGDKTNRNILENFEKAETNAEKIPYAKILLYNYQDQYNKALDIKVPDIAKEANSHYLESLKQNIEVSYCVINNDSSGYDEAAHKAFGEYTEAMNEMLTIWENFDKEAEGLGLPKPSGFPETSPNTTG